MRKERDWKMKQASHTAAKEKRIDMYYGHHDFSKMAPRSTFFGPGISFIYIKKKIVLNLSKCTTKTGVLSLTLKPKSLTLKSNWLI